MEVKKKEIDVFVAGDGKEFLTEQECMDYENNEKLLKNSVFLEVDYSPDLCETGGFRKTLRIAVVSNSFGLIEKQIIGKLYCIKRFGYAGPSVQGNGIQEYFFCKECSRESFFKNPEIKFFNSCWDRIPERLVISDKYYPQFADFDKVEIKDVIGDE